MVLLTRTLMPMAHVQIPSAHDLVAHGNPLILQTLTLDLLLLLTLTGIAAPRLPRVQHGVARIVLSRMRFHPISAFSAIQKGIMGRAEETLAVQERGLLPLDLQLVAVVV